MKRMAFSACLVLAIFTGATWVSAQSAPAGETYAWWEEFPYQADANFTKEERRAYNQAYKAAVEERLRNLGLFHAKPTFQKVTPDKLRRSQAAATKRVPGTTITYHSGSLGTGGTSSQMLGNQFDSALNPAGTAIFPIEASGSVTMATFDMIAVGGTGAFFSMYHNLAGTTAPQITSAFHGGLVTGLNTITINSLSTSNAYSGGTFLAGMWQITPGDTPALATGTVMGQGFHAVDINDGMPGNNFATVPSANAAISVTGNLSTPVELMNFKVE